MNDYELLDTGWEKKWERFGPYIIQRPCFAAPWRPQLSDAKKKVDLAFSRDGKEKWTIHTRSLPESWVIEHSGVKLQISPTDFGHLGIFPEHQIVCKELEELDLENKNILNLFAYTGLVSIYCALKGASVIHLDASKPAVLWAQKNAALNGKNLKIRYIIDDVIKFLQREVRRKNYYDGIILDPPTYGRGPKGEVFKIEKEFVPLMQLVKELLGDKGSFLFLSSHTPGYLPSTLKTMVWDVTTGGEIKADEMALFSKNGKNVSLGCYALWKK